MNMSAHAYTTKTHIQYVHLHNMQTHIATEIKQICIFVVIKETILKHTRKHNFPCKHLHLENLYRCGTALITTDQLHLQTVAPNGASIDKSHSNVSCTSTSDHCSCYETKWLLRTP